MALGQCSAGIMQVLFYIQLKSFTSVLCPRVLICFNPSSLWREDSAPVQLCFLQSWPLAGYGATWQLIQACGPSFALEPVHSQDIQKRLPSHGLASLGLQYLEGSAHCCCGSSVWLSWRKLIFHPGSFLCIELAFLPLCRPGSQCGNGVWALVGYDSSAVIPGGISVLLWSCCPVRSGMWHQGAAAGRAETTPGERAPACPLL